jgi:hypothetical protein
MNLLKILNTSIFFFAFFILFQSNCYAQRIQIKVLAEDSTFINNNGDSSQVYSAYMYFDDLNALTSLTLAANYLDANTLQWVVEKDTSYTWNTISLEAHSNLPYQICKPNDNMLKLCLGRLYFNTRKKFQLLITDDASSITNKEIQF